MDEKSRLLERINFEAIDQADELQHPVEVNAANLLSGFEPQNDPTMPISRDLLEFAGVTPLGNVCTSKTYESFTRDDVDYECRIVSLAESHRISPQMYLLTVSRPSQLRLEAANVVFAFRMPAEGSPTLDDPGLFLEGFPDELDCFDDTEKVQEVYEEFEKAVNHSRTSGEVAVQQPMDWDTPIEDLEPLGVTAYNHLKRAGIYTIEGLACRTKAELKEFPFVTDRDIDKAEVALSSVGRALRQAEDGPEAK